MSEPRKTNWSVGDNEWIPATFAEYMARHLHAIGVSNQTLLMELEDEFKRTRKGPSGRDRTEVQWGAYERTALAHAERVRAKDKAAKRDALEERLANIEERLAKLESVDPFESLLGPHK
jgi:hypothetical protein